MLNSTSKIIRDYIVENFLLGQDDGLTPTQSLLAGGILDSTGVVELTMFLEKEFGIQVSDEDLVPENMDSITAIAAFVERCRGRALRDSA